MRVKILVLGLICFFIFTYCNSPADPEIEKALNPGPTAPVVLSQAILTVSTIPELPIFTYHPYGGEFLEPPPTWSYSTSEFIIVITETNGVGGELHSPKLRTYIVGDFNCTSMTALSGGTFEAFGTVPIQANLNVLCKPTVMQIYIDGHDLNGYVIDMQVEIPFIWAN